MGVCLSCTRRTDDEIFSQERTGLLSEYGPTSMATSQVTDVASLETRREEAMARIVAMTEENLIDIFAVGAPDRRVNGQPTADYKALLNSIKVPDASAIDKPVKILPPDTVSEEERFLMAALGKSSSDYVESLYTVKSVGSLVFMLED
ncbi:hypothetical protein V1512DRAFT_265889 [Lipomyces arxii]|uniref:uncharacterized protein n=1 Tax=Lipomyces arxii TaxID=56418 RepID=UPI0034CFA183